MKRHQLFTLEDWSDDVRIISSAKSFKEIIKCAHNYFPPSDDADVNEAHVCLTERTADWIGYEVKDWVLKYKYGDSEIQYQDESVLWIHGCSIITFKNQKQVDLFEDLSDECEISFKLKKWDDE